MTALRHEEYVKKGYVSYPVAAGFWSDEDLLDEIDRISESHDNPRLEMEPNQKPEERLVRRIYEPCSHYALFCELSDSPKLMDAVESLWGPDIVFPIQFKINMKPPSIGSVVEWHQDVSYYPLENASSLAILICLDAGDVENGCLQVIPGHHNGALLNHTQHGYFVGKIVEPVDESEALPLEGKAGTVIFMHCMTPHSSVTNRSNRPRRTLMLSYRSADSLPIYTGDFTNELESCTRLARGKPAESARFSSQQFPIPLRKQHIGSLYELQELSRKQIA